MKKALDKNLFKFIAKAKVDFKAINALENDASRRFYYRLLSNDKSILLMDASLEKESLKNFINISRWLIEKNYSAPIVYSSNLAKGYCILEDFGEEKFSNLSFDKIKNKYNLTIELLVSLSKKRAPKFLKSYSRYVFFKELNLFINWYLYYNKSRDNIAFEKWRKIWGSLFSTTTKNNFNNIVLRDFHIDNLFWLKKRESVRKIGLIDFQDALIGHPCYDLVSLLQDVRINIQYKEQLRLYNYYMSISNLEKTSFEKDYYIYGTQRLIKIIGIFYKLKYLHKKENYMKYIPRTWHLLKHNLNHPGLIDLSIWFKKYVF